MVVRIVEGTSVRVHRPGAEHGVVHHALHAVAVTRVARDPQKITRDLEMRVRSAWCLEAIVGLGQALEHVVAAGSAEHFIGSPTAGGEALRRKHLECVLCGEEMFVAAQSKVRLHRRTQ